MLNLRVGLNYQESAGYTLILFLYKDNHSQSITTKKKKFRTIKQKTSRTDMNQTM